MKTELLNKFRKKYRVEKSFSGGYDLIVNNKFFKKFKPYSSDHSTVLGYAMFNKPITSIYIYKMMARYERDDLIKKSNYYKYLKFIKSLKSLCTH